MPRASSFGELKSLMMKELQAAMQEARDMAYADLWEATGAFYGGSPKKYVRTGQLLNTPRATSVRGGGASYSFKAYLDDSGGYSTGSKPGMGTVLGWAIGGGGNLVGHLEWYEAVERIKADASAAIAAHFG